MRASSDVIVQIRQAIMSGQYRPGDRLPTEREMAQQFGVSRVTVRDALRALEANGLVRVKVGGQGGPYVSAPDIAMLSDSIGTHLHLRGKSMKYTLTWPDGQEEVLLDVPKYDFNWQLYYELATPKKIPAGSKVTVVTLFDNSLKNPYNPSPEKEVYWSEQSWDEMYAPQARITVDSRGLKR